ncbi:class I SAM-dependent methyltransferase [Nakamurella leprariae]|uniref:Class I SAM-dependent methyltransferase n=1 Tax=Nakamurella leprariae TaxID=2803911 RepID=A0A938Y5S9_9ACTN|nr:class I SAM-dependent methyltransferase [Nakamurella leprariae]MBM9466305.1 class I SAM-dependent methyltransferase [Nakamurella leprariae]
MGGVGVDAADDDRTPAGAATGVPRPNYGDRSDPGHAARASAFALAAGEYARFRPGYPAEVIAVAVPDDAASVLDLAAGTGKLTGAVVAHLVGSRPDRGAGVRVVAVDPLPEMLAELRRAVVAPVSGPVVEVLTGSAEHIPLPTVVADGVADTAADPAGVDVVLVAQAFHWFDAPAALAEAARISARDGRLVLLWNLEDRRDALVDDVTRLLDTAGRPADADLTEPDGTPRPPYADAPDWTDPDLTVVEWVDHLTAGELIARTQTYSYLIRAEPDVRDRFLVELRDLLDRAVPGSGPLVDRPVEVPMRTLLWSARRRGRSR